MAKRSIVWGSRIENTGGYARIVIDDEWVFVAGCTGFDYAAHTIAEDVTEQTEQTFRNIHTALSQACAALDDVFRVRVYVDNRDDLAAVSAVVGREFADVRPANTTVIAGLADPRMRGEIEVTARRGAGKDAEIVSGQPPA